jgi:ankyrin repeat protein
MLRFIERTRFCCLAVFFTALMSFSFAAPDPQPALERLEVLGLDLRGGDFARAVEKKQQNVIELMLRAEISPNLPDAAGRTPLFHAAAAGDEKLVARLLEAGADPNLSDAQRVSPLMKASATAQTAMVDALIKAGADVNTADATGRTPLLYAISAKQLAIVDRLLTEKPRSDVKTADGNDALGLAVEAHDEKLIQKLLDLSDVRQWDHGGRKLLQQGVEAGDVGKIRRVLAKHVGPPTPENCKEPLLAYAVASNDLKLAALLLESGADPNTALQAPVEKRFLEYTPPKFLQHYLTEEQGMTVLMIAAGMGHDAMVRLLIEHGAERNRSTRSKYQLIALYFAAWGEHAECIQTLIGNAPTPEQVRIEVSLSAQRATLYRDGTPVFKTGVSTGRKGFSTPTGRFVVTDKKTVHVSTIYKVKMPFFMRLSCRDFGMHEGVVPDYPASHGCIRLPGDAARKLFKEVPIGTMVTITN